MSVTMKGKDLGDLKVELEHESGAKFTTVAPKDNNGEGNLFSPTDLVPAALGSCILMTMAMVADRNGVSLKGSWMEAEKEMSSSSPRRVDVINMVVHLPVRLDAEYRKKMEVIAGKCPVHHSIHPETKRNITFKYDVE